MTLKKNNFLIHREDQGLYIKEILHIINCMFLALFLNTKVRNKVDLD